MRDEAKNKLRESLRGAIIERGDGDYDDARALYNAVSSKHIEQGKFVTYTILSMGSKKRPE